MGNYINTAFQTETIDWMFFVRIFTPSIWLCVVSLFIAIFIMKWIFVKLGVKESTITNRSILFWQGTLFLLCQAYYR